MVGELQQPDYVAGARNRHRRTTDEATATGRSAQPPVSSGVTRHTGRHQQLYQQHPRAGGHPQCTALDTAALIQLPKGRAFALLEGGQLWKIRLPLPVADKHSPLPESVAQLVATDAGAPAGTTGMSEQQPPPSLPPQGPIGWLLSLAGRLIGLVIGALVLRIVPELAGLYFWWPQEGAGIFFK